MRARLLFILTAAVSAFIFGWWAPPPSEQPVDALRPLRLGDASVIARPGSGANAAAAYLAALNPPPPPPPGPPKPKPPPPPPAPPPPDVAQLLAAAVTAIIPDRQGLALVLVDAPGSPGRRVLRQGDVFGDGWTLQKLTRHEAVLQRGPVQRIVSFFPPFGA